MYIFSSLALWDENRSYLVGTGTSVSAPNMTACCSLTKATKGLSRKSTSPTRTLEASASLGSFFMNLFFSWTHARWDINEAQRRRINGCTKRTNQAPTYDLIKHTARLAFCAKTFMRWDVMNPTAAAVQLMEITKIGGCMWDCSF